MRHVLRLMGLLLLGPIVLALLLVLGIFAFVGLQLLWQDFVARVTAPPDDGPASS